MPMGCVACVLLIQRNTSPKGSETGRKIGEKNGDARFFCTNCERPEGTAFRIVHPNRPKTESPDFATGSPPMGACRRSTAYAVQSRTLDSARVSAENQGPGVFAPLVRALVYKTSWGV